MFNPEGLGPPTTVLVMTDEGGNSLYHKSRTNLFLAIIDEQPEYSSTLSIQSVPQPRIPFHLFIFLPGGRASRLSIHFFFPVEIVTSMPAYPRKGPPGENTCLKETNGERSYPNSRKLII